MIIFDNCKNADQWLHGFDGIWRGVFYEKRWLHSLLAFGVLAGCAPQGQQEPVSSQAGSSAAPEAQYEQVTLYLPNENADGMVEESEESK